MWWARTTDWRSSYGVLSTPSLPTHSTRYRNPANSQAAPQLCFVCIEGGCAVVCCSPAFYLVLGHPALSSNFPLSSFNNCRHLSVLGHPCWVIALIGAAPQLWLYITHTLLSLICFEPSADFCFESICDRPQHAIAIVQLQSGCMSAAVEFIERLISNYKTSTSIDTSLHVEQSESFLWPAVAVKDCQFDVWSYGWHLHLHLPFNFQGRRQVGCLNLKVKPLRLKNFQSSDSDVANLTALECGLQKSKSSALFQRERGLLVLPEMYWTETIANGPPATLQQAQTSALLSLLNLNQPVEFTAAASKSGSGFELLPASTPPVWKILVLDQQTKDVLATVPHAQDLCDSGATLRV